MFNPLTVILVLLLYMALLFMIAYWAERRVQRTGNTRIHPLIYVLSLTVFTTSWEFYGSVGYAVRKGPLFVAIHIGALLAILSWGLLLRKMVHIKEAHRITSIADFISARYNRSQWIAALTTLMALFGIVPYIALQLKAIVGTFSIISTHQSFVFDISTGSMTPVLDWQGVGLLLTLFLILFTVVFGVRHLDPTERHQGVITALALECVVKLVAMGAVCYYVSFNLYDGFADLQRQLVNEGYAQMFIAGSSGGSSYGLWVSFIILGAAGIQFLPRQFHVAVIENCDERHIRWAMLFLPLYLVLINLFVLPIAAGGILTGIAPELSDYFVLLLPQQHGELGLALFVFIGGFAAATGMIILSTMTLSTMVTNHLLLPVIEKLPPLRFLRRYLLQCRWLAVTLILLFSFEFAQILSAGYQLVTIGVISLVAILQFTPAMLGGLLWRHGNRSGALLGLHAGMLLWIYTLIVPLLIDQGLLPTSLLTEGPGGLAWLRPTALFGIEMESRVPHAVFWSMLFNGGLYWLAGLWGHMGTEERNQASEFVAAKADPLATVKQVRPPGLHDYINLQEKIVEAEALLCQYIRRSKVEEQIAMMLDDLQVKEKPHLTIIELVEFHRLLERILAGSLGAASAHRAIVSSIHYSKRELRDLEQVYSHICQELEQAPDQEEQQQKLAELTQRLQARETSLQRDRALLEAQEQHIQAQEKRIKDLEAQIKRNKNTS
ncbi:MAG: hypothetical protein V7731_11745 [Amphritea sp.]